MLLVGMPLDDCVRRRSASSAAEPRLPESGPHAIDDATPLLSQLGGRLYSAAATAAATAAASASSAMPFARDAIAQGGLSLAPSDGGGAALANATAASGNASDIGGAGDDEELECAGGVTLSSEGLGGVGGRNSSLHVACRPSADRSVSVHAQTARPPPRLVPPPCRAHTAPMRPALLPPAAADCPSVTLSKLPPHRPAR